MIFNIFFVLWLFLYPSITLLPSLLLPVKIRILLASFLLNVVLKMLYFFDKIDYQVIGKEHLPKSSFIVASQHQSAFETAILYLIFKNPVCVLKKELKYIPILGLYLKSIKMIFIDRSNKLNSLRGMLSSAKKRLNEGMTIIIYPQGSRIEVNKKASYNRGIAALYQNLAVPVVPIALNTGLFWGKNYFSTNRKPGTATIKILKPIAPGLTKDQFMEKLENDIETNSKQLLNTYI